MKQECYGKNHEVIERIFPRRLTEEEKTKMSFEKERQYQREFKPYLKLIDGLEKFFKRST
jgi:beta-phosphoglucomutase